MHFMLQDQHVWHVILVVIRAVALQQIVYRVLVQLQFYIRTNEEVHDQAITLNLVQGEVEISALVLELHVLEL